MIRHEFELYEPMRDWLDQYLRDKYKQYEVITYDSHADKLDKALSKFNIRMDIAVGLDIQIDVLGILRKGNEIKLVFIEAKKNNLTLKDLGQLWSYCMLVNPIEAFLFSSSGLGSLGKIVNIFLRDDLLNYGDKKNSKQIVISPWNAKINRPDFIQMIPKK